MWGFGNFGQLLLGFESTAGVTPGAPTVYKMPFSKNGLKCESKLNKPNGITGTRNPRKPRYGNKDVNGDIVVPIDFRNYGLWLKAMYGDPVTTNVSTAGKLTGATGVTTTIGTWTAVTDGKFKVAIDGSAATEVGPVDFSSGVTTMAHVAAKIQTAVRAIATGGFSLATVVFDPVDSQFIITSGTTGASSSVSQMTAPAAGTNISGTGFMKCTAGTLVTGAALYQHVFKIGTDETSLFIEKGFTDLGQYYLYNGCKVSKASYQFGGDADLESTLSIMGMRETPSDTALTATPTELEYDEFAQFDAVIKEGGAVVGNIQDASLDIDFSLKDAYCVGGQGFRGRIGKGMLNPSGKITALFEDAALVNKAINGTSSSIELTLTNGRHSLDVLIEELVYERTSPTDETPDGLMVDLNFTPYYDSGASASTITTTLINDVASY